MARLIHAPVKRDFVDIAMEFSMASITSDHEILIMGVDGGGMRKQLYSLVLSCLACLVLSLSGLALSGLVLVWSGLVLSLSCLVLSCLVPCRPSSHLSVCSQIARFVHTKRIAVKLGWNHSTVDALREVAIFSLVEREVAMKHCNMLAFGEGTTNEVRRAHKADDVAFALHSGWTHRPASRCPDLGLRTVDGGEARVSHQPLQHPMRLAYFVEMVVVCAL